MDICTFNGSSGAGLQPPRGSHPFYGGCWHWEGAIESHRSGDTQILYHAVILPPVSDKDDSCPSPAKRLNSKVVTISLAIY